MPRRKKEEEITITEEKETDVEIAIRVLEEHKEKLLEAVDGNPLMIGGKRKGDYMNLCLVQSYLRLNSET